jgi:23S rRNA (cytidine1920-2'-O)/16S rRNA (cytidine1409-2'-O)-methyltransferase
MNWIKGIITLSGIFTNNMGYLCPMEERLDKILIQRNLVSSRVRAEQIIREVGVRVEGKLITKNGKKFPIDCNIDMIEVEIPWVSRGALKLLEAIHQWKPMIKGTTMMDIGASTGGFTEVLLQNDVAKVYCVDVGKDQLHEKVKSDARIVNLERTHVRELTSNTIKDPIDGCVIDVAFISLEKIFPFIHAFLKTDAFVIALVKPQFEVGKENVSKGGIVKNKSLYPEVIEKIKAAAKVNNLIYQGHINSPILGGDGNTEFLMLLKKN